MNVVSRARRLEGGERLVTVVDFPCAIAECCDVQLDCSIRNNEVQSCDITSALRLRFKHVHARYNVRV